MFFGRASSRRTWRWLSRSSAASSIVTMRSSSGIAVESAFSSVVLPEPVPPEMRMFSSACTQRSRNSTASVVSVPSRIRSSRSSRLLLNFRIVTSGPLSESGGMMALTRLPSGRRASTIGDDSSTRRPTCATILLMIRRRCDSSLKRTVVSYRRPWRSTQMSYGPLTMISVTLSSASSRSSGPWPSTSSAISAASRSRSSRAIPLSCARWRRMSAMTRSRSAAGSMLTLKSCGPRSPMTARWTRFLSSENGSCPVAGATGRRGGQSLVKFHQLPPPQQSESAPFAGSSPAPAAGTKL